MKVIGANNVQLAMDKMVAAGGLERVFEYFDQFQPSLVGFVMKQMSPYDSGSGSKALMLCYLVAQAFDLEHGKPLPKCNAQTFDKHWVANENLFRAAGKVEFNKLAEIMQLEWANQPALQFAITQLMAGMLKPAMSSPSAIEASITIYFVVKTLIDTFDSVAMD